MLLDGCSPVAFHRQSQKGSVLLANFHCPFLFLLLACWKHYFQIQVHSRFVNLRAGCQEVGVTLAFLICGAASKAFRMPPQGVNLISFSKEWFHGCIRTTPSFPQCTRSPDSVRSAWQSLRLAFEIATGLGFIVAVYSVMQMLGGLCRTD